MKYLPSLIALTGYAEAGKDELAKPLIEAGYVRLNFGDVIKNFYADFLKGQATLPELRGQIMLRKAEGITAADVDQFLIHECGTWLLTCLRYGWRGADPVLASSTAKAALRPVLECGGELIYDHVFKTYFDEVQVLIGEGKRVINTRLCKVPEVKKWRRLGGKLWEVHRLEHPPATPWDEQTLQALKSGGWVDMVLLNKSPSGEAWQQDARMMLGEINTSNEAAVMVGECLAFEG